jgi:hypothetical protein
MNRFGELAQLARALALQARGQGFDSLILHQEGACREWVWMFIISPVRCAENLDVL